MSADGTIPEAATLLADKGDAAVWHATWQQLAEVVGQVDTLIVDAPYSERTHAGHDESAGGHAGYHPRKSAANKRALNYEMWKPSDVEEFVSAWSGATTGWLVSITDHVLAHTWQAALEAAGRYVFSPLAFVAPGSRVRLGGDGPAQWACWIVASRPAKRAFSRWGSLPGGYVLPPGHMERMPVVGGKPSWLMERLVSDYSRPGDLVCDPCCGAGTTLTAAVRVGRRAVGGDMKREHAEMAARAVSGMQQRPLFGGAA
jgi:site-specific DNA-methyltransferase (adenine-specific)